MRSAARCALPPAEAMRPEPPARYRRSWLERAGLAALAVGRRAHDPAQPRSGTRCARATSVDRHRGSPSSMLVLGTFFLDSIDVLMDVQFNVVQRQDVTVTFVLPRVGPMRSTRSAAPAWRARSRANPRGSRPAAGWPSDRGSSRSAGLVAAPELNRVVDVVAGPVALPPDGLVLSLKLAEVLGVGLGDPVSVEVLEGSGRRARCPSPASSRSTWATVGLHGHRRAQRADARGGHAVGRASCSVDPAHVDDLYQRLKATPAVAGVALKGAAIESFEKTLAETFYVMIFFNLLFSGVIAVGVVYNAARIVAVGAQPRAGEPARARVHARRDLVHPARRAGRRDAARRSRSAWCWATCSPGALVAAFNTELYRFPLFVSAADLRVCGVCRASSRRRCRASRCAAGSITWTSSRC